MQINFNQLSLHQNYKLNEENCISDDKEMETTQWNTRATMVRNKNIFSKTTLGASDSDSTGQLILLKNDTGRGQTKCTFKKASTAVFTTYLQEIRIWWCRYIWVNDANDCAKPNSFIFSFSRSKFSIYMILWSKNWKQNVSCDLHLSQKKIFEVWALRLK